MTLKHTIKVNILNKFSLYMLPLLGFNFRDTRKKLWLVVGWGQIYLADPRFHLTSLTQFFIMNLSEAGDLANGEPANKSVAHQPPISVPCEYLENYIRATVTCISKSCSEC